MTHQLDRVTAAAACAFASVGLLRGADAVYVATASQLGATLVTLDREMIERAGRYVEVRTPGEWLADHEEAQG
jgi:predicted nucleic acid-binding protein